MRHPVGRNCKRPEILQQHVSGGPDAGAAEIGCVWALQGRGLRPRRPGKPEGKRVFALDLLHGYERHPLGLRSVFNGLVPRPTTTRVRVRELGGDVRHRDRRVGEASDLDRTGLAVVPD